MPLARPVEEQVDYNQLKVIVFDQPLDKDTKADVGEKIIIMNIKGERIRETVVRSGNIFSSALLYPLIQRSDLIMKIDSTSYYLLDSE